MKVKTVFCNNYFPPTVIEVIKWKNGNYLNQTNYRVPVNGKYPNYVFGIWKVKYKKLDPNFYYKGQININNKNINL